MYYISVKIAHIIKESSGSERQWPGLDRFRDSLADSTLFPRLHGAVYVLPQLVELLFEPLGYGLSVDSKNQFSPVRRVF